MEITIKKLMADVMPALNSIDMQRKTRLSWAAAKLGKQIEAKTAGFKERSEALRVELCLTDEKTGELLTDEKGNFRFDKEGRTELARRYRELTEAIIELDPVLCSDERLLAELPLPVLMDLEGLLVPGGLIEKLMERG